MKRPDLTELILYHSEGCMRLRYGQGQCTTRRCLERGGWKPGTPADPAVATCETFETVAVLQQRRDEDVHELTLSIVNEGALYPRNVETARLPHREARMERYRALVAEYAMGHIRRFPHSSFSPYELELAAQELEEYYQDHVAEMDP